MLVFNVQNKKGKIQIYFLAQDLTDNNWQSCHPLVLSAFKATECSTKPQNLIQKILILYYFFLNPWSVLYEYVNVEQ